MGISDYHSKRKPFFIIFFGLKSRNEVEKIRIRDAKGRKNSKNISMSYPSLTNTTLAPYILLIKLFL